MDPQRRGFGKKSLEILVSQKIHQGFVTLEIHCLEICVDFFVLALPLQIIPSLVLQFHQTERWPATEERGSIPRISKVGAAKRWPRSRFGFCGQCHCSTAQRVAVTVEQVAAWVEDGEFRHSGCRWFCHQTGVVIHAAIKFSHTVFTYIPQFAALLTNAWTELWL